eukprot:1039887-Pleurochrysis_carterae.AAC.2
MRACESAGVREQAFNFVRKFLIAAACLLRHCKMRGTRAAKRRLTACMRRRGGSKDSGAEAILVRTSGRTAAEGGSGVDIPAGLGRKAQVE